nr:MAG TPA: hypothetical protein [Caudoviricetes sp.]
MLRNVKIVYTQYILNVYTQYIHFIYCLYINKGTLCACLQLY